MSNKETLQQNNVRLSGNNADLNSLLNTINNLPKAPSGTIEITENGTHDVKDYESANVNVQAQDTLSLQLDDLLEDVVITSTNIPAYGFRQRYNLKSVIGNNVTLLGTECFGSCTNLKSVEFPKVEETTNNGQFTGCVSLENVYMPLLVNGRTNTTITFDGCKALKQCEFPKLEKFYSLNFRDCTSLEKVDFGENFRYLGTQVFLRCSSFMTLIIRNSSAVATLNNVNAFSGTPIESGTGYIYVPSALIEDYKVATNWSTYANQFRAIEDYPDIIGEV